MSTVRDYLSLMKLRVVALLVLVACITAAVAAGGLPPLARLLPLVAAGTLASAGATVLNHYLDRDIDAIMDRTRRRPLPSGRIKPLHALVLGLLLVAVSVPFALGLGYSVVFYTLAGAATYVLVYTCWLKRRSSLNIVIGGLAGSCAVAAGWAAIGPATTVTLLLALVVFLWTPAHFWSFAMVNRSSYSKAAIPMVPVLASEKRSADYILVYSGAMVLASLVLYFAGPFSGLYLLGGLLLGGMFLASNVHLRRRPSRELAWSNYKLSGIYLLGLFLVMLLDTMV